MEEKDIKPNLDQGRPSGIKALIIFFLLISFFYALKLSQVFLQWSWLERLPLSISPYYLAVDSLVWLAAASSLVWGIWKRKGWASPAAIVLSLLYGLVFWVDRIWISEPDGLEQRWAFNLVLTIIGSGLIFFILSRKSSREYFRKNPAKIP